MGHRYSENEIKNKINMAKRAGIKVILGKPDNAKGFDFYYVLVIPPNTGNTMVMDCLNYNNETGKMETEQEATDFYSNIFNNTAINLSGMDKSTYEAIVQRIGRTINTAERHAMHSFKRPTVIPIIPEKGGIIYGDKTPQELRPGIAKELAPQIEAMLEDAIKEFETATGQKANEQLISFGHSSSASFANNFTMLYPERIVGLEIGGKGCYGLPIDSFTLKVVDKKSKGERYQVDGDGKVIVEVTQKELEQIKQEYTSHKKDFQMNISENGDGTYLLPLNFPLGLADIEHYRDLSEFPGGKEGFRKAFANIPRFVFYGEHEERVRGGFAYESGKTHEGIVYEAGDSIDTILAGKNGADFPEIEWGPMHSFGRMQASGKDGEGVDYQIGFRPSYRILFGEDGQEQRKNFSDLTRKLGMSVITKVYPNVGHVDPYSKEMESDCEKFGNNIVDGKNQQIIVGTTEMLGIYQQIRHFMVCTTVQEFRTKLKTISQEIGGDDVEWIMSGGGRNLDSSEIIKLESLIGVKNVDKTKGKTRYQLAERGKYVTGKKLGSQVVADMKDVETTDKENEGMARQERTISQTKENQDIGE